MNGATKLPSSKKHFRKLFPHFCADGTTNFGIQRFCFASFGIFCSFDNKTLYDWPLMARLFVNIWPFITKNWTQLQQNCKSKFKILSNTKLTLKNCPRLLQIRLMCLHCYTATPTSEDLVLNPVTSNFQQPKFYCLSCAQKAENKRKDAGNSHLHFKFFPQFLFSSNDYQQILSPNLEPE